VGAGLVAGIDPLWMALAFAVDGALGSSGCDPRRRVSGDLALALFFYSGIALGVVLVSLGGGFDAGVLVFLFGQPLTVNGGEIVSILALVPASSPSCGDAAAAVRGRHRRGLVARRRPAGGRRELRARRAHRLRRGGGDAHRGILLVAAMMVLPVASGQLLARSFSGTLGWSVASASARSSRD
jgi:zinc transport system permease protein